MTEGIIIKALSGFYYVQTSDGLVSCKARGRFRLDGTSPLVGDRVLVSVDKDGSGEIFRNVKTEFVAVRFGNVLGSNIFNILLILGASATVTPLSTVAMTLVDLGVLLLSIVLVWLWTYTGHRDRVDRWEAILMLMLFFGYYTWLFVKL